LIDQGLGLFSLQKDLDSDILKEAIF
jgi:hypothetical protein